MTKRICTVSGCDRTAPYKLYCTKHYRQMKKFGEIRDIVFHEFCQAPGCNSKANRRRAGLCEKHYMRMRRNGTFESIQKRIPDAECIAEDCHDRAATVAGYCRNCHLRLKSHGTLERHVGVLSPLWLNFDEANYRTVHQRIRKWRGSASGYICVDCGENAYHWSYNHSSIFERTEVVDGFSVSFSPLVSDYDPRCVKCHKKFDLAVIRSKSIKALPRG